jgi:hypothetical protein
MNLKFVFTFDPSCMPCDPNNTVDLSRLKNAILFDPGNTANSLQFKIYAKHVKAIYTRVKNGGNI